MDPSGTEGEGAGIDKERKIEKVLFALVLCGVCVLAALPFFADAKSRGRVPDEIELNVAVEAVRAAFEPGDAVRVEPSWWVLPWRALERMGPGTEKWPFPALLVSEDLDPVEAMGYRRLYVLAGFGREPALPKELEGEGTYAEVYRGQRVAVGRWDLGETPRLRTLTREWDKLVVERTFADGAKVSCKVRGGKHRCGRDGWMDVAIESRVVWRRETRWLFTHPGPRGSLLEVAWPGLPRATAAGPTWLYLRVGPTLEAVRHAEGGAVRVAVLIDGAEVDAFDLEPHRFWMERRAVRMPPGTDTATVALRVSGEDVAWRETVLEADVLSRLPDALRAWATHVVE